MPRQRFLDLARLVFDVALVCALVHLHHLRVLDQVNVQKEIELGDSDGLVEGELLEIDVLVGFISIDAVDHLHLVISELHKHHHEIIHVHYPLLRVQSQLENRQLLLRTQGLQTVHVVEEVFVVVLLVDFEHVEVN